MIPYQIGYGITMIVLHYTKTHTGYTLHLDGDPSKRTGMVTTSEPDEGLCSSPYTVKRMATVITGKPFPTVDKEGVRVLYPDGTVAMDTTEGDSP